MNETIFIITITQFQKSKIKNNLVSLGAPIASDGFFFNNEKDANERFNDLYNFHLSKDFKEVNVNNAPMNINMKCLCNEKYDAMPAIIIALDRAPANLTFNEIMNYMLTKNENSVSLNNKIQPDKDVIIDSLIQNENIKSTHDKGLMTMDDLRLKMNLNKEDNDDEY